MKVLLLGATGNLGLRLIPALLVHGHEVVIYVRNIAKLRSLASATVLDKCTVMYGDATDSPGIEKALLEHDCNAVMNTAGNQVLPWNEWLLPKIARAVTSAAINVGKQRGKPLRAWLIGGMGLLRAPGSQYFIHDYFPAPTMDQHAATKSVLEPIPTSDLQWSLLCVAFMRPISPLIDILPERRAHNFSVKAGEAPDWVDSWVKYIPLIGNWLNVVSRAFSYTTKLEDVADFIAEDLAVGSDEWVGKKVGFKNRNKSA